MPLILVTILMGVLSAWALWAAEHIEYARTQRLALVEQGQALVFSEVKRYHLETGLWPSSLENLSTQAGFQHLKSFVPRTAGGTLAQVNSPWRVVTSNVLTSGTVRMQRTAVIGFKDPTTVLATYLAAAKNTCNPASSTADFYSTANWCGSSLEAVWSKTDTLELRNQRETWAYKAQKATADKLIVRYRVTGNFPTTPTTATALRTLVTPSTLSSTVGTGPADCLGQFSWQGIGFECGDLYNQFGNPVSYRWIAAKQFQLSSNSQILNSSGSPLALTTTITMP